MSNVNKIIHVYIIMMVILKNPGHFDFMFG